MSIRRITPATPARPFQVAWVDFGGTMQPEDVQEDLQVAVGRWRESWSIHFVFKSKTGRLWLRVGKWLGVVR